SARDLAGREVPAADEELPQPHALLELQHAQASGGGLMDWRSIRRAQDGTHHTLEGSPLYETRFDEVLAYHEPGLAPVRLGSEAWHIDVHGRAAYARRFRRTFGFYEGRAAAVDGQGWCHILPDGTELYPERYAWCGNFQG